MGRGPGRTVAHLGLAAALACCALGCGGIDLGGANVFSVDDEWRLGRELSARVEREKDIHRDPEVERLIDELGHELVQHGRFASREWNFHVIREDTVNAFNIPGGHVYVHDALVLAAGDAAEFMAVLAHETAHGTRRHGTQQVTAAYGLSVIVDMAFGRNPSAVEGLAANVLAGGILADYSREMEREADAEGLRLMVAAGYDPEGMVRFFSRLLELRQRRPNEIERFLGSHPLTESRIADVRQRIEDLEDRGASRTTSDRFDRLRRLVR